MGQIGTDTNYNTIPGEVSGIRGFKPADEEAQAPN
jgi:hypothetical protein